MFKRFLKNESLGVPNYLYCIVVLVCLLGIIFGSLFDYQISSSIVDLGSAFAYFFESWGLYPVYCLFPFAGTLVFISLKDDGDKGRLLGWVLLVFSYILGIHYLGSPLRYVYGYSNDPALWRVWLGFLTAAILLAWVPPLVYHLFKEQKDKGLLLRVGLFVITDIVVEVEFCGALKELASRPRYRFLVSSDNVSGLSFRNWWEWAPFSAVVDGQKSFPSGHASFCSALFSLPLLLSCLPKASKKINVWGYVFAFAYSVFLCFTRILNGGHFLSDVSFGLLYGLVVYFLFSLVFIKPYKNDKTSFSNQPN